MGTPWAKSTPSSRIGKDRGAATRPSAALRRPGPRCVWGTATPNDRPPVRANRLAASGSHKEETDGRGRTPRTPHATAIATPLSVAFPDTRGSTAPARAVAARAGLAAALLALGGLLSRVIARLCRALPCMAAGVAAAVPVLVSTVHAVRAGWEPAGDDGIIVTRAWDVLTAHSPLIGQYSESGLVTGQVVHSPGPLLYWLLALPARFGSPASIALTMGVMNTLAIVGCVALARRRGGLVLMFATAAAIALMCQALSSESLHDVWNPAAGLFPFLLLIFLCWSLACGDHRLLPLTVLVASFVTQTHLTYVVPTAGMLAVALGGLIAAAVRRRRAKSIGEPGFDLQRARAPVWRWVVAAVLVAGICWAAPAIDEIEGHPGNLTLIVQTAGNRGATLGAGIGWNAVVRAVGWQPWWLSVPPTAWSHKNDVRATPTSVATDSTLALLAALGLLAAAGFLRRRANLGAAALIGLALCASLDAIVAQTPSVPLLAATTGYTTWWGAMVGLWVWLVLAWSLWLSLRWLALASARLWGGLVSWTWRLPAGSIRAACVVGSLACLGGIVVTGAAVAATQKPDSHASQYRPITAIAARLDQVVPAGQTVRLSLGASDISTQPIEPAVRYFLVRHGDLVLANGSHQRLGYYYELERRPYRWLVVIANGSRHRKHMMLAITVHFSDAWGRHAFSAWVARVGPGRALELPRHRSTTTVADRSADRREARRARVSRRIR
jgi:hypothetical protein